jgi:uncharacterized protein YraI
LVIVQPPKKNARTSRANNLYLCISASSTPKIWRRLIHDIYPVKRKKGDLSPSQLKGHKVLFGRKVPHYSKFEKEERSMGRSKWILASRTLITVGALLSASFSFAETSQSQGIYTTTATVNVRKGPGTNYQTVAKIPKGTSVQVVGKQGPWLKVQSKHGNPPGYIDERFALPRKEKAAPPQASSPGMYTTTATVNVRRGPGTSHAIVAKIPKNSKVQVVGAEGDWLKVQSKHGNPAGYIQKTYAKRLAES